MTLRRLGLAPCFLLLLAANLAAAAEPPVIRVGLASGSELVRISAA